MCSVYRNQAQYLLQLLFLRQAQRLGHHLQRHLVELLYALLQLILIAVGETTLAGQSSAVLAEGTAIYSDLHLNQVAATKLRDRWTRLQLFYRLHKIWAHLRWLMLSTSSTCSL
jgi:hypothetical protein